jgi:hypothetical protein
MSQKCSHCKGSGQEPLKCDFGSCSEPAIVEGWVSNGTISTRMNLCKEHIYRCRTPKHLIKALLSTL